MQRCLASGCLNEEFCPPPTNVAQLLSAWTWIGIGYTFNRYTFSSQPLDQAFYILAKPQKTMVVGWGNNSTGQCDVPMGTTNAMMVAGGGGQSLALLSNGTVVAWGQNGRGQGSVPTNLAGVTMIAAGWFHDVALLTNGTVTAWGLDGYPLYNLTEVPSSLTNATVISAQALHSLALTSNGTVVAWGYGPAGEASVPSGLSNVVAIAAGGQHNLAAKTDGTVTAWGLNTYGQCNVPAGLSNVVDVAAGPYHSLALLKNGTVVAWGDGSGGETNVPLELTNVVAIAASGDFVDDYSLALKSDGTVVAWGQGEPLDPVGGLSNVIAIAAGAYHALAIRSGPPTPVITLEPVSEYQLTGGSVTFTTRGQGLASVQYQWQFNGVNISGETGTTLTLTNIGTAQQGNYQAVISDGNGSLTSSIATLTLLPSPVITAFTQPAQQLAGYQSNVVLSVTGTAPDQSQFPLSYQWQFNGTNISGATGSDYTFFADGLAGGSYSVIVSNATGSTNVSWSVHVLVPGSVWAWGANDYGQSDIPPGLTNVMSITAGLWHSLALRDDGTLVAWGDDEFGQTDVSPGLSNVTAIACGLVHSLALRADGTLAAWGEAEDGDTNVPTDLTNVVAIAAGGTHNLAMQKTGTLTAWGSEIGPMPANLTNVTAIAAGADFDLALRADGIVLAWGANGSGQTNVPSGLTNVVAISAGAGHGLALKNDGTVVSWGGNSAGQANVPSGLSNVMAVAGGAFFSMALRNDGTVVVWGDNTLGQTNVQPALNGVKTIAAGGAHALAASFSSFIQYPVDVTKDLLLIYNSSSVDSSNLCRYYMANRPMVTSANVLGVACDIVDGEFTTSNNCDSQIVAPLLNWLTNNPTKHPQYLVLFFDMPTRIYNYSGTYPSVTLRLYNSYPGTPPFITYINAGTLADCTNYVNKLANIGTNYSPGQLIISASVRYANTNYYFDDAQGKYPAYPFGFQALQGVTSNGVPSSAVFYEPFTSSIHITQGTNVAGYFTWGDDGGQGGNYYTNVLFSGNSSWYLIETIESFNGIRGGYGQGNFTQWFSSNAFGGSDYSSTPVGAVTHVEEPVAPYVENSQVYFGLWAQGKNFGICAWNSRRTPYFQAVGDPFVVK